MTVAVAALERRVAALAERRWPARAVLSPVDVCRRVVGEPDAWQRAVLASSATQRLLLCGRQTGKTSTAATLALHQVVSAPDSTTVVVSPSLRQSQLLYAKVRAFHRLLGADAPAMAEESALRFTLVNGASVLALPGDQRTIRGYTADLVIEDEAARVDDGAFAAVVPFVATTGGPVVLLTTPAGKRGHFHALWEGGDPAWERTSVTSYDVPRIDRAWLDLQRRTLPDHQFRAEFLCEFVETDDALFRYADIEAVLDPTVAPLFGAASHAA